MRLANVCNSHLIQPNRHFQGHQAKLIPIADDVCSVFSINPALSMLHSMSHGFADRVEKGPELLGNCLQHVCDMEGRSKSPCPAISCGFCY